jgi:hypothetical protein
MKKKIIGGIAIVAYAAIIGLNVKMNSQESKLTNLALANVEALAEETGGNAHDCPGGYCSFTDNWGNKCEACAPTGKNPKCNSYGCEVS